jgi:hypothetical protein
MVFARLRVYFISLITDAESSRKLALEGLDGLRLEFNARAYYGTWALVHLSAKSLIEANLDSSRKLKTARLAWLALLV